jgi:hypothetical protein
MSPTRWDGKRDHDQAGDQNPSSRAAHWGGVAIQLSFGGMKRWIASSLRSSQ